MVIVKVNNGCYGKPLILTIFLRPQSRAAKDEHEIHISFVMAQRSQAARAIFNDGTMRFCGYATGKFRGSRILLPPVKELPGTSKDFILDFTIALPVTCFTGI